MADDAHARPSGDAEPPLYDPAIATPSHAERARTLVERRKTGTLCTLAADPVGYPYGSLVTVALRGPNPVFLISALAEHTKNLERDPRASLLVAEDEASDPLANGRVTLLGPCRRVDEGEREAVKEIFLAAHPGAAYYVDFRDFGFFMLRTEAVRYIGGYGRMSWVSAEDWRDAEADPLADAVNGIVAHMNADHLEAMLLLCRAFSRAVEPSDARMTHIDRYGFEMSVTTDKGPRPVRVAFEAPVADANQAREAIVSLVRKARAAKA